MKLRFVLPFAAAAAFAAPAFAQHHAPGKAEGMRPPSMQHMNRGAKPMRHGHDDMHEMMHMMMHMMHHRDAGDCPMMEQTVPRPGMGRMEGRGRMHAEMAAQLEEMRAQVERMQQMLDAMAAEPGEPAE